jgi:hypothetical protein
LPGLPQQGSVTTSIMWTVAEPSVQELYPGLRAQALEKVQLAMKVAVMQQAGISRGEIAERLGVSTRAVREAVEDLQGIAHLIELGERPGDDTGELTL